ncbi:Tc toxin subunit A-related protein [Streptomyces sp. NPDC002676]
MAHDRVVGQARTDEEGVAVLEIGEHLWREPLVVRIDHDGQGIPVPREALFDDEPIRFSVRARDYVDPLHLAMLADYLVATRRVLASDLANDLTRPALDSMVRLLTPGERVRLLDELGSGDERSGVRLVDPDALRDGIMSYLPPPRIDTRVDFDNFDPDKFTWPKPIWGLFPWALSDDQSYRDYLRGVFVLFAHQQKLEVTADPTAFPNVVEQQLQRRFFQDFRTTDGTERPLNKLLIPIVTAILTAPTGSGFGFAVPAASIPAQGSRTDRAYLDALLALAPVSVDEVANRYRLPLREPDTTVTTPLLLNAHTLSRVLSDTAQGPVEPTENVVDPQLPDAQGKPILWPEVVGSAPFFLRFDEWLGRQQPFFPENLFAPRTQVDGVARGLWLDDDRKKFLQFHESVPATQSIEPYKPYFGSIGEVHRSATFLLRYGAADAKLVELVQAIDEGQFTTAARLADEAEQLLDDAAPSPATGENWEPEFSAGNFPRPASFARRRAVEVATIDELTGSPKTFLPDGFERFLELGRPTEVWVDVVHFRIARDFATRLRVYQQRFLLPMLRAMARSGAGDIPGAIEVLSTVTGLYVGIGMLGTPSGMVRHPDALEAKRVVAGRLRWDDPLGDRPYTARLMYTNDRRLDGPYPLTPQVRDFHDVTKPDPSILHPLEEHYARLVQADALLDWGEMLYRTDDPASLERARELYKAVVFLHGEDPGTMAYRPPDTGFFPFDPVENPRRRNQLDRARLALQQLEAGLNFYGYNDETVPTLRYQTLVGAAQRWTTGAKSAQNDYLAYLGRVEQLDLDLLAAQAQQRKAQATVAIAAEQVEVAKAGVVVAQKLVTDVGKLIEKKQQEIDDSKSIFNQFKDYFSGMKSSVTSIVDVGKDASSVSTSLGVTTDAEIKATAKTVGSEAWTGSGVAGGVAVVGGFAAFSVLSTMTLQGMAKAATKREDELKTLSNETLPAAQAAVRVQERQVAIANLQAQIAATDLAYARDLVVYQNERFLNRDFWDALAGVARRSLHRYLDLAGQAAWFAERALAYQLATPLKVIRLGYFDPRMRDIGGVDQLSLDLAELEAVRLGSARLSLPLTRTYSLARDLPLAFGQLKQTGRCTFTLTDDDLLASHPGTYAHRVRTVDVLVDAPGTVEQPRGILTNLGFSLLRRSAGAERVPLLRFADAYPISEFRIRRDLELYGLPGEQLLPFEGTAFTTTWTLELPSGVNPVGLGRITDVLLTFDLEAAYDASRTGTHLAAAPSSRSLFVSALSVDTAGLSAMRVPPPTAKLHFALDKLPLPHNGKVTNLAVLIPGVDGGRFDAKLRIGTTTTAFQIENGVAMSNLGVLSDGNPANALPLNAATGGSPDRAIDLEINKGNDADRIAAARDVLLWVEYDVVE